LGYNDKELKQPMKKDAMLSNCICKTEAITRVAIMQLVEEGKILLDDPGIYRYR
jgi:CubicO group peptidase (beta-lactamase class C family)